MSMAAIALVVSVIALVVSIYNAISAKRQRTRQEDAAVTGDLYPVLRTIRDAAWEFGKPLGGQQNQHLVTLHNAVTDLIDLRPAVRNVALGNHIDRLLSYEAVGLVMSIDPARFVGAGFGEGTVVGFADLARDAHSAVQLCQGLRRGAI